MSTVRSFARRHPVAVFFALGYALAWGALPWHSFFAPGQDDLRLQAGDRGEHPGAVRHLADDVEAGAGQQPSRAGRNPAWSSTTSRRRRSAEDGIISTMPPK